MADMDVDMDVDNEFDPEIAQLQAKAASLNAQPAQTQSEHDDQNEEMDGAEDGEVAPQDIVAYKVHIQGLESLSTADIENFAHDHFQTDDCQRIEWIDDNSANLVYENPAAAAAALGAFTAEPASQPLEPRRAKPLATHPYVELFVRESRVTDVKEAGAAKRSRFYLQHPEMDPENRPQRRRFNGSRRGGTRGRGGHRSRRSSGASSYDEASFDVNLYDDGPKTKVLAERRTSTHSDGDLITGRRSRLPERRSQDRYAGRDTGRLRDRSASPARDGDGDGRFGFTNEQPYRRTPRYRSPPPIRQRSNLDNYGARQQMRGDLFGRGQSVELFPHRTSSPSSSNVTELFPNKVYHNRQDSQDRHPDQVAKSLGECDLQKRGGVSTRAHSDRRPDSNINRGRNRNGQPGDLFSRTEVQATIGRLENDDDARTGGFTIKGAGAGAGQGFAIKGASQTPVRELFPGGGKDLFESKIIGRATQRRLAEDLFD